MDKDNTETVEGHKQLVVNHEFLIAFQCSPEAPIIRSARSDRKWMDESNKRFIYRCLPLTLCNSFGWDILCPCNFVAVWTGGPNPSDVKITFPHGKRSTIPSAHFGAATLTLTLGHLFRTPPGINLFVKGPPNSPKDGIIPLEGIVETDFSPATFTMNWLFTRKNHEVIFEAGESYCRIFPIPRFMTEVFTPEIHSLEEDSALLELHMNWRKERDQFNKGLAIPGSEYVERGWQKDYFKGGGDLFPRFEDHQTKLHQPEFRDCRSNPQHTDTIPDTSMRPMVLHGPDGKPLTLFVTSLRHDNVKQAGSYPHPVMPHRDKPGGSCPAQSDGTASDHHATPGDGAGDRE